MSNILPLAVAYDDVTNSIQIIDQRLLPDQLKKITIDNLEDASGAIKNLAVRGAPAIGIMAGYALAMVAIEAKDENRESFVSTCYQAADVLSNSRPTAVNLFQAINLLLEVLEEPDASAILAEKMLARAKLLHEEDKQISEHIAAFGESLLKDGDTVMTYCNAGALATGNTYGTALAPIYKAQENGKTIQVVACETRPILQGSRLTSFELTYRGISTTLICDNMIAYAMKNKDIAAVFVGCDRVARNGDMANKIGTYGLALLAKSHDVPFYVCAPSTTIDALSIDQHDIPIEERDPNEIKKLWFSKPMACEEVDVWNPAFDITPANLITAYITENGIVNYPFDFRDGGK